MSLQTQIDRIVSAKDAIASAIEGKGVNVPETAMIDDMAALIESISSGGDLPPFATEMEMVQATVTSSTLEVPCSMSAAPTHYLIYEMDGASGSETSTIQYYTGPLVQLLLPEVHTHKFKYTSAGSSSIKTIRYNVGVRVNAAKGTTVDAAGYSYTTTRPSFTLAGGVATLSNLAMPSGTTVNVIMWRNDT